jgi:hypothetical protein
VALTLSPTPDAVDAAAVSSRISEAEQRLRAALLAGDPTRALHDEIAALRAEAARSAATDANARAEAEAQAAQAHQARVAEAAASYAATIERRLTARMAGLVAPPFIAPTTTGTPSP